MEQLASYLSGHGVTQTAFASRIGCSQPYLARLLTGERSPSLRLALRIQQETGGVVGVEAWHKAEPVE